MGLEKVHATMLGMYSINTRMFKLLKIMKKVETFVILCVGVDSDNDNNDDVDDGCQPMASTPKKKFGDGPSSKHNLTPDSKRTNEPTSKRTHITMSPTVSGLF